MTLCLEEVECPMDFDEWFSREVDMGLSAADGVEFLEHEDIPKLIISRYPS